MSASEDKAPYYRADDDKNHEDEIRLFGVNLYSILSFCVWAIISVVSLNCFARLVDSAFLFYAEECAIYEPVHEDVSSENYDDASPKEPRQSESAQEEEREYEDSTQEERIHDYVWNIDSPPHSFFGDIDSFADSFLEFVLLTVGQDTRLLCTESSRESNLESA